MAARLIVILYNGRVEALVKCDDESGETKDGAFERWYDEQPREGSPFARDEDPTEYDVTEVHEHDEFKEEQELEALLRDPPPPPLDAHSPL